MRTNLLATSFATFPFVPAQQWLAGEPLPPRTAVPAPRERAAYEPPPATGVRRLVVGMRGSTSTAEAVAVATALAGRHGATVDVLSVYEPRIPYPVHANDESPPLEATDLPAAEAQLGCVRRVLTEAAERDASVAKWPIHLEVGQAAARLAHAARAHGADLIVLGRGRQAGDEPWLLDRTALKVSVVSTMPVLSVAPGCRPPRRMLLAVGLDELTLHVARAVRQLFPDLEQVDLVHVRLDDRTSDAELNAHFDRIALVLGYPPERLTRTVLEGDPVAALLDHAAVTTPDCIASGLHSVTAAERSLARNLSLHLLDRAKVSVLIVPK